MAKENKVLKNDKEEVKVEVKVEGNSILEWNTFNEEQQKEIKAIQLKSLYGYGGEHFSTYPTVLDPKKNPWTADLRTARRVNEQTFRTWEQTGNIILLNIIKGSTGKNSYMVILLPERQITFPHYDLEKSETDTLTYEKYEERGNIRLRKNNYHITNSYSNIGKTIGQMREISKHHELGINGYTSYTQMNDDLRGPRMNGHNTLILDINDHGEYILQEVGKNSGEPTGRTFNSIGEYLDREPHTQYNFSLQEISNII